MSVINKMLRDLDRRQPAQVADTARLPGGLAIGTVAVGGRGIAAAAVSGQPGRSMRLGLGVLAAVVLAGVAWWAGQRPSGLAVSADPAAPQAAPVPVSVPVPVPVPTAQVGATAPAVSPDTPATQVVTLVPSTAPALAAAAGRAPARTVAAVESVAAEARVATAAPVTAVAPVPAVPRSMDAPLRLEAELSTSPLANRAGAQTATVAPKPVPASAIGPDLNAPRVRPLAAQEVLAQAQERWSLGERAPAVAMLQAAITRLEGAGASEAGALAALTREYVRMSLALGQASAASAMLVRLESPLAAEADIWALRGNVAQRLGQHPQAVHAYLQSLSLRPHEPRWMLGAAVSLAAQGQLGPAGELAEQARQAGALPPDVANYLRQLGVAVRPD